MNKAIAIFSVVVIACAALCVAIPIPSRPGGYKTGNPAAPVLIEMWGDFQCMDCRKAWPIVRKVLSHFSTDQIFFILHPFPLTMHRQAWDAAQTAAIVSVQPHVTSASLFSFFDYLWQNQPSFSQAAFYGKTQADLYSLMASYASHWGVTNSTFYGLMGSDQIFNIAYNGVQMGADRHVHSTPTFYINGLHSTFDENTTYDQWVAFINQLL